LEEVGLRRGTGVLGASVATAALACSGAAAANIKHNKIVFQGTGSYGARYVSKAGETFVVSARFRFRTVFPRALFSQDGPGGENLASINASSYSGSWKASVTRPGQQAVCGAAGRFGNPAHGTAPALFKYRWNGQAGRIRIRASGLPGNALPNTNRGASDCSAELMSNAGVATSDFWHDWIEGFSQIGGRRHDVVSADFEVPDSAITSDRAVETFSAPPAQSLPAFCKAIKFKTCTQTYGWTGSITFSKLA
jgi:hypothetical protein